MGKYGYCGMKKVLVPGTNEDVHYIKLYNHLGSRLPDGKTLCGQQLHSINTVHVTKINVTCKKCLKLAKQPVKRRPKLRKSLTPVNIARLIRDWHSKTITEWAKEFDVTYQTVLKFVLLIRKESSTLCVKGSKRYGRATRAEIVEIGIDLYKRKQK